MLLLLVFLFLNELKLKASSLNILWHLLFEFLSLKVQDWICSLQQHICN